MVIVHLIRGGAFPLKLAIFADLDVCLLKLIRACMVGLLRQILIDPLKAYLQSCSLQYGIGKITLFSYK